MFGRKSYIEPINIKDKNFIEWSKPVYADLRGTKYGCRIFRYIHPKTTSKGIKLGLNN